MAAVCSVGLVLYLAIASICDAGHIPMRFFNSAEPDAPIYVPDPSVKKLTRQASLERLTAVRQVLAQNSIDAYIIPTADAHNSQYIAPAHARREWVSGLRGSSGTALVTASHALVWTDARYFTQFYVEVDTTLWELMRQAQHNGVFPVDFHGVDDLDDPIRADPAHQLLRAPQPTDNRWRPCRLHVDLNLDLTGTPLQRWVTKSHHKHLLFLLSERKIATQHPHKSNFPDSSDPEHVSHCRMAVSQQGLRDTVQYFN